MGNVNHKKDANNNPILIAVLGVLFAGFGGLAVYLGATQKMVSEDGTDASKNYIVHTSDEDTDGNTFSGGNVSESSTISEVIARTTVIPLSDSIMNSAFGLLFLINRLASNASKPLT